jgi:hypothetical protein
MDMQKIVLGGLAVVFVAGSALAAQVGITGKKLVIVDKLTAAGKAKLVYVAKDTPANKGAETGTISASFEYQCPTLGSSGGAAMPAGGFIVNKATVAKYVNKPAPTGGAVKVAVIKPTKLLKAVMKDLGDAGNKIDIYQGGATTESVDVNTQYTVFDSGGVREHCGEFTGCKRKIIGGGTGAKVVCKTPVPGGSVSCPGSPSASFLR